jgi:hypothetical protein
VSVFNTAEPEDQVPRLQRFREKHPEIDIMTPIDTRSAWWKAYRNGEHLCTEIDLRHLLDDLDRLGYGV